MPEESELLSVFHAQGPDELYAAASKEKTDTMASTQNEQVPMAKCIVITSPWAPVEHWKTLAEQNAEDAKQLRWGWKADLKRLNAAKVEITALSKNVTDMTREDFAATLNNLRRMGAKHVHDKADVSLQDAMDLAYLTGQRVADATDGRTGCPRRANLGASGKNEGQAANRGHGGAEGFD